MIDFYSTTSLLYFTDISLLSITIMLRSKAVLLGSEANKKEQSGHHYNATQLFSKAIHLIPFDYRFYLNYSIHISENRHQKYNLRNKFKYNIRIFSEIDVIPITQNNAEKHL